MRIDNADIRWLESGLPFSRQFEDVYFSRDDARGESEHVFVSAHRFEARWRALGRADTFSIAELGFGCGLNFLQTWRYWQRSAAARSGGHLHYLAFELHPLTVADLRRVLDQWPDLADLAQALLARYPDHSAGCHRLMLAADVTLDLYYGDAGSQIGRLPCDHTTGIHAWYADGFSPRHNAALWQQTLFEQLAACSHPDATLSTYSVAGQVRRNLQAAGFMTEKRPGFGSKREMLVASLKDTGENHTSIINNGTSASAPWFRLPAPPRAERRALVVGGGLAGCCSAYSLARRGWQVTVLDAAQPLAGASGNPQLALRARLIAQDSVLSRFYLHSYLYTLRFLRELPGIEGGWHECGLLQLDNAINKRRKVSPEKLRELYPEQVLRRLSEDKQRQLTHVAVSGQGWFFPTGGWLEPGAFAEALLTHDNIQVISQACVTRLEQSESGWQLFDVEDNLLDSAPLVILANGHESCEFTQTRELPLRVVRGQTTNLAVTGDSDEPGTVICGERTVFPALNQTRALSASYANDDDSAQSRAADDASNLRLAREVFRDPDVLGEDIVDSRVSFRAATPDRAPMLGPVPDMAQMRIRYADLSRDASSQFTEPGRWLEGLYINAGHGSNGLATAPYCAEILASLLTGTLPPVNQPTLEALNPVRFLIRDLKKQRL